MKIIRFANQKDPGITARTSRLFWLIHVIAVLSFKTSIFVYLILFSWLYSFLILNNLPYCLISITWSENRKWSKARNFQKKRNSTIELARTFDKNIWKMRSPRDPIWIRFTNLTLSNENSHHFLMAPNRDKTEIL